MFIMATVSEHSLPVQEEEGAAELRCRSLVAPSFGLAVRDSLRVGRPIPEVSLLAEAQRLWTIFEGSYMYLKAPQYCWS
jgi:hypothetical protein